MPSNDKIARNELLLPNIVLFNQLFVDAQRIDGHNKDDEAKARLPNLQATSESVCSCSCHDEVGSKNNLKSGTSKQYIDYVRSPLEFVNIVDHAPIEMKFLSRTEIREPLLGSQDICTRWLERVAKSIQEELTQTRSALEMHQDVQQVNSQSRLVADWELNQSKGIDECCADMLLRGDRVSVKHNEDRNLNGKVNSAPLQKDEIGWRTPQRKCLYPDKQNLGWNEDISKATEEVDKNLNLGNGCELLFQFSAKRMDLIERDGAWQRKEMKISPGRKCRNGYEISIDLLKPKGYCGAGNEEKDQQRNEVKQKVCLRFERRFKSAPKERTHRNNDETIKSNKVHLYPFSEAKWIKDKNDDKDCEYFIIKDSRLSPKRDTMQNIDVRKGLVNIESPTVANEHLKISSLQLVPKNSADERQKTDSKVHPEERRKEESKRNVMKVVCSTKFRTDGHNENEDGINDGTFDVDNMLTMSSVSLRETLKLLGRITASSMLLTDKQILQLMESGNLKISKFLTIKKLLLSIHPSKYVSVAKEGRPRKEIAALLSAVLEFIDRCEKILKKAKGLSNLDFYERNDTEIDCTKRGIVIGKMPPISVMSYNYKSDVDNDDHQPESTKKKKKKNKIEPIKTKKIHAKKDSEEEHLVEQAVSMTSLRKMIFVRAVDLVMNNHWEKSLSLKKRYMPKRKKIKSLKPFSKFSHKKHMPLITTAKLPIKKSCYPSISKASSSRNSVSTCFMSDELQDIHIPTEQSIVNEITKDMNVCSLEFIPDMKEDKNISKDELFMVNEKTSRRMDDEETDLKRVQEEKPIQRKVCEFLKRRVETKLRATFDLYPKIHKLISSLHGKTEDMIDIRAARDMKTDFKLHFKLIEENRYEMYCKAFAKTDRQNDGYISVEMIKNAVKLVDSVASCPAKYIDCTLTALDMLVLSKVSIKMFCIVCGILEKMLEGGIVIYEAVESLDLLMAEGKMIWYKDMFYESADSDKNYINLETVKLELFAGGMSADKEKQISDKIVNKENHRISYLDFIAYIPLFVSIHEKICANALN